MYPHSQSLTYIALIVAVYISQTDRTQSQVQRKHWLFHRYTLCLHLEGQSLYEHQDRTVRNTHGVCQKGLD